MVGITLAEIKYRIYNMFISSVLFLFVYAIWINDMPRDLTQLFWIWVDSFSTGWISSVISRKLSGNYRFKLNLRFWIGNFLVSCFYAFMVWLGLIGIMLSAEFNFVNFVIIVVVVKLLIYYAAYSNSSKFAEWLKKLIG